jgi:hypothetical protein
MTVSPHILRVADAPSKSDTSYHNPKSSSAATLAAPDWAICVVTAVGVGRECCSAILRWALYFVHVTANFRKFSVNTFKS